MDGEGLVTRWVVITGLQDGGEMAGVQDGWRGMSTGWMESTGLQDGGEMAGLQDGWRWLVYRMDGDW